MFIKAFVSGCAGLSSMVVLFILLPKQYAGAMGICFGYAVAYGVALYLDALPEYVSKEHVQLLIFQLVTISLLTPWLGLTVDAFNVWFGRYFFAIFVVLPFIYEIIRYQVKKRVVSKK